MISGDPRLPQLSGEESQEKFVAVPFYRRFQERFYTLWRELARDNSELWARIDAAGSGTVQSVDVSGGTTGLTVSGGPVTTSGTLTLAGTLDADNGGTGQSSYAVGDLLYASGTTTLSKLADVATGSALISGGVGVAPSWGKVGLTTHISGTLGTANGGTGLTSFTANGVVYASSTSALTTGSGLLFDGTNLGIGTSPSYQLHVQSTGLSWTGLFQNTTNNASANGLYVRTEGSNSANRILVANSGAGGGNSDKFYVAGDGTTYVNGNVGIGTPSPGSKLHVSGYIRHSGFADVQAFGGDAQAAIDSLPADGGTVFFPPGEYTITTKLTCSNKSLKILGAGCGASRLVVDVATGIEFAGQIGKTETDILQIQDITILAKSSERTYAVKAEWTESGVTTASQNYRPTHCVQLTRVEIGSYGSGGYFKYGVHLTGAHNALIDGCAIDGSRMSDDTYVSGGAGIYMTGDLTPVATDAVISNTLVARYERGIQIVGEVEGTHVKGCSILSCKYGITTDYDTSPGPGLWVSDNHINCHTYAIYSVDASELIVSNNSIWSLAYDASLSGTAVYGVYSAVTSGSARSLITNNVFWLTGSSRTNAYCVYVAGTGAGDVETYIVSDNRFGLSSGATNTYGVYLSSNTAGVLVTDTNYYEDYTGTWTAQVSDNGTNTVEGYNTWTPTVTAYTGTITTVSDIAAWYYRKRNTVHFHAYFKVTTNGTGATLVKVTLPIGVALKSFAGSGRAGVSGKALQAWGEAGDGFAYVANYDNTYPASDGEVIRISGHYQI